MYIAPLPATTKVPVVATMLEKVVMRQMLSVHISSRSSFALPVAWQFRPASSRFSTSHQSITKPSFWASLVPKSLRASSAQHSQAKNKKTRMWNPATFYIVIFLLIGSMSIQMITLRNEFNTYSRRADAKIELLKEIIDKVKKGEEVDVEGLLGTGDPKKEMEWEQVLREIENEDELWVEERRKKPRWGRSDDTSTSKGDEDGSASANNQPESGSVKLKSKSRAPPGFY